MKKRISNLSFKTLNFFAIAVLAFGLSLQGLAQTAANTDIRNVASATYSDGTDEFSAVSNEVVVTVAKVAGLTITPDGQTDPTVVPGQTGVTKTFRVTNIGNFTDEVRFLSGGQSVRVTGPATITAATAGGVDIFTNTADVLVSLAQNGFVDVVVTLSVNASATAGSTIQVFLGDQKTLAPTFDNDSANESPSEVRTVAKDAVNGLREARGDISTEVAVDALPKVNLTAPSGPVALGSNITYTMEGCNIGERDLMPVTDGTLNDTQVYLYAPIPAGTRLTNVGALLTAYPGRVQFTTSALSVAPTAASWSNLTLATPVSSITRIRIAIGETIPAGTCRPAVSFDVEVTTNTANYPILEIVEIFGENSIGSTVTDQSGDDIAGTGDGNANFDEPTKGEPHTGKQGLKDKTTLLAVGGVINGTKDNPDAIGPTDNNDDFTNQSVRDGINVAPGGTTTADNKIIFTNTLRNTGNVDDKVILTAPIVPVGFIVRISIDGGTTWFDVDEKNGPILTVLFGETVDYLVEVYVPEGVEVLQGYDVVIRATSIFDPSQFNDTIDRVYTGFIKLEKSFVVENLTGVGGPSDAVPGADIIYTITYTNISTESAGSGNYTLTARNLVITEDGNAAPNNWGSFTKQVVGSASDSNGGSISGDEAGSTVLTDTVSDLAPQMTGTFSFRRKIK